jgi:hypothetical protein
MHCDLAHIRSRIVRDRFAGALASALGRRFPQRWAPMPPPRQIYASAASRRSGRRWTSRRRPGRWVPAGLLAALTAGAVLAELLRLP